MADLLAEAHAVGVIGRGAIATPSRKMLADEPEADVIAAMDKVLPAPIDYFLLHHFFEMLYRLDERFREEWDAGVRLSSGPPHALQTAMLRPYDAHEFRSIMGGSFAHKLRYKYRPDELTSESYLARLLRGDLDR